MTEYEKINRRFEKLFFGRVNKAIKRKIDEFISVIKENGLSAGRTWLSRNIMNPEVVREVERLYVSVGIRYANKETRSLRSVDGWRPLRKSFNPVSEEKGFGFNAEWVKFILEFLRLHLIEKITFDVDATTRKYLLKVLSLATTEGWGVDKTVRNLNESGFSETQAARIVRTEINRAANAGVRAAGETYEYEMQKEWVAIKDSRTRGTKPEDHASHVALNGTVIDFDDVFIDPRNGDRLREPGDPNASAASTVECRCTHVLKPKRDSRGRLIPKRQSTSVIYPNQIRRGPVITIGKSYDLDEWDQIEGFYR